MWFYDYLKVNLYLSIILRALCVLLYLVLLIHWGKYYSLYSWENIDAERLSYMSKGPQFPGKEAEATSLTLD